MSNLSKLEIVRESDFLEFYPYEDITFPGLIVRWTDNWGNSELLTDFYLEFNQTDVPGEYTCTVYKDKNSKDVNTTFQYKVLKDIDDRYLNFMSRAKWEADRLGIEYSGIVPSEERKAYDSTQTNTETILDKITNTLSKWSISFAIKCNSVCSTNVSFSACNTLCTTSNGLCSGECGSSGVSCGGTCGDSGSSCTKSCGSTGTNCTTCSNSSASCKISCSDSGTNCYCNSTGLSACNTCPNSSGFTKKDINIIVDNLGLKTEITNISTLNYIESGFTTDRTVGINYFYSNNTGIASTTATSVFKSSYSGTETLVSGDKLSIDYMINSEAGYDKVTIYFMNGSTVLSTSGPYSGKDSWNTITYSPTTYSAIGNYSIKVTYYKGGSTNKGADMVWIRKPCIIHNGKYVYMDSKTDSGSYGFTQVIYNS